MKQNFRVAITALKFKKEKNEPRMETTTMFKTTNWKKKMPLKQLKQNSI